MRVLLKRMFLADPSTFTAAFAVWTICVGATVAGPGESFIRFPFLASLERIYPHENFWGWLMIINGVLLLWSIRLPVIPFRAMISLVSAVLWLMLGVSMIINTWIQEGRFSTAGTYSVWCAIQSLVAVEQWVVYTPTAGGSNGGR